MEEIKKFQSEVKEVGVLIIGGGIAGLVAARDLSERSTSILLLESSPSLGGSIARISLQGVEVDAGAESFAISRSETLELIESLGISDQLVSPTRSDARIQLPDGALPIPHGILGIPSDLSDPALTPFISKSELRAAKNKDSQPWLISGNPTIGEVVRERLGEAFVTKLLAPLVGGVHAANPDLLEMEALAPGLLATAKEVGSLVGAVKIIRAKSSRPGSAVLGLRKGIFTLIDALERDLRTRGVEIALEQVAQSVVRIENGWLIKVADGEVIKAHSLVLAVPAHRAAQLITSEPTLSLPLSRLVMGDVALVLMVVRSAQLNLAPLGSGILIAPGSLEVLAKASTHATAKWGELQEIFGADIHLLRFSYGRDGVLPEDMENLPAQALRDAEKIYGVQDMELLESKVVNWPKSLIHAQAGHLASIKEMREALAHFENLTIVGAGLGGNGITGVIQQTRESVAGLQVA